MTLFRYFMLTGFALLVPALGATSVWAQEAESTESAGGDEPAETEQAAVSEDAATADESAEKADESAGESADEVRADEGADGEGHGSDAAGADTEEHASGGAGGHDGDASEGGGHEDSGAGHGGDGEGAEGHGDGHGDGHETGLPLSFKSDLALWSLITFVIFLFVMKKLAWGPLIEGLDQREAGIRASIAAAEENQRKSQALLADYEEKLRGAERTVAEMVAEAKRDAERTSQDIVAKAQAEVEAMRERAKEDIAQAKDTALAEVFSSVNAQVAAATERVLGRALSDEDQDRLIQEALTEISA